MRSCAESVLLARVPPLDDTEYRYEYEYRSKWLLVKGPSTPAEAEPENGAGERTGGEKGTGARQRITRNYNIIIDASM